MEKVCFIFDTNDENPEVVAVFLNKNQVHADGLSTCYSHNGQHSTCSLQWARLMRTATEEEYLPLYDELVRIGYKMKVMKELSVMEKESVRLCRRCGNEVISEKEIDYPYYCPHCDENMYAFETVQKEMPR